MGNHMTDTIDTIVPPSQEQVPELRPVKSHPPQPSASQFTWCTMSPDKEQGGMLVKKRHVNGKRSRSVRGFSWSHMNPRQAKKVKVLEGSCDNHDASVWTALVPSAV